MKARSTNKVKPMPFQEKGVEMLKGFEGRCILADEMGLGKTFQALLYAKGNKDARPIIVVCPASLKSNWSNEAWRLVGLQGEILTGRKPPARIARGFKPPPLLIINYDILGGWLGYLRKLKPQLIILDEVHYIKNMNSARSKNATKLCRKVPHVIALSGTPLTNTPIDLYPVLKIVRPDLCTDKMTFAMKYTNPCRTRWGWTFKGSRNLEKLHRLLKKHVMIRRRKKEVLSELPTKRRFVVLMDVPDMAKYKAASADFLKWLSVNDPSRMRKAKRALAITRMNYLKRLATELKMQAVFEWLDKFMESSPTRKILVFCIHQKIANSLMARYGSAAILINGTTTTSKRQDLVDEFQNDKRVRMMVGNLKAAGVGLNMTKADTVATIEFGWTPDLHIQAEDRAHRIGQTRQVDSYFLIAADTIEQSLCELIQNKQEVMEASLDGETACTDFDIFDLLLKSMEPL
jgi:SWI/SNF-related matrix-associated actin-dependent regulator 1 of chromatin subfamily A